jgi:hypothetical protein
LHPLFTPKNTMQSSILLSKRNRITTLVLMLQLLIAGSLSAQTLSGYSFVAYSGTFSQLTNPTVVLDGTNGAVNDGTRTGIPVGFTFTYAGSTYDSVMVNTNGFMVLSGRAYANYLIYAQDDLQTIQFGAPVLAPLWDDLLVPTGGKMSYKTTGTAGSRVFTMEWLNMAWTWTAGTTCISFQAKLYEASGNIEYVYRQEAGALSQPGASIGINNSSSIDFWSINNTSAAPVATYGGTPSARLATKPATGQVYRWGPAASVYPPSATLTQPTCASATGGIVIASQTGATYSIDGTNFQSSNTFSTVAPGTYTIYVQNNTGRDSSINQVINAAPVVPATPSATITQPTCTSQGTIDIAAQSGVTYSIDGSTYTASPTFTAAPGTYTIYVKSTSTGNCVASLAGQVVPATGAPDVAVTSTSTQLTSAQAGATSYQWVNCGTQQAVGTSVSYAPVSSGSYAVIVSLNGCTDTSSCTAFVVSGISIIEMAGFKVYPSPAADQITISYPEAGAISITNILGEQIYEHALTSAGGNEIKVLVGSWPAGIYYCTFSGDGARATRSFSVK